MAVRMRVEKNRQSARDCRLRKKRYIEVPPYLCSPIYSLFAVYVYEHISKSNQKSM